MDLIQFQFDVANNHQENIKAFIAALAQERGNKNLERLSHEFGFVTGHWEHLFEGHRVALGKDINKLLYGIEKTTHLRQLCERHGLSVFTLKGSDHNRHSLLKAHFRLAATVNTAHLVAWPHILLAAAYGETAFARKLMAYIMTMVQVAEAEQESREQTGLGLQENLQQQQRTNQTPLVHLTTDAFEAMQRLLISLGYHPTIALITAAQYAQKETGFDLGPYLNNSPQMLDAPPQAEYYPVSMLEQEHQLPFQKRHGHFLNQLLEQRGLQTRNAREEWEPTPFCVNERIHGVRVCVKSATASGVWSGFILKWHPDYIKGVVQWWRMAQGKGEHHG